MEGAEVRHARNLAHLRRLHVLADGKYYFRVVASDRESNSPSAAREAILDSNPVMIDNTPPAVTIGAVRYADGSAHIEWEAADAASALRRCEYSLDAGDWIPVEAADGVIDSLREKFALDLAEPEARRASGGDSRLR